MIYQRNPFVAAARGYDSIGNAGYDHMGRAVQPMKAALAARFLAAMCLVPAAALPRCAAVRCNPDWCSNLDSGRPSLRVRWHNRSRCRTVNERRSAVRASRMKNAMGTALERRGCDRRAADHQTDRHLAHTLIRRELPRYRQHVAAYA